MALICKQLRPIDIPAQESVCKGPNLHRRIRQGVAEDPWLMHRVKKVAFRTRLQSGMSLRVYNHHFFTRNNSCLDLSRQCHAPRLLNVNPECRQLFGQCFLLLTPIRRLVLVGTPEVRFLHQWCAPVYSAHTKASLRTFFCPKTIWDRSYRYEKLCAPKTAFAW